MILFVGSSEGDYLQDLTFAGLSEVLGAANVVDFPWHKPYHARRRHWFSAAWKYPRTIGFSAAAVQIQKPPDLSQVRACLKQRKFRFVVLAAAKPDALDVFSQLVDDVSVPWIFIDGGDRTAIGGDFERIGGAAVLEKFHRIVQKNPPKAIFKRERPLGFQDRNIFPLPFSADVSQIPVERLKAQNPKTIDVQFWAVESSVTRRKAFELLRGKYDCDTNGSRSGQKFRRYARRGENYFAAVNRCRISLSFRGEGFDTLRFWETPACGSLLLSEAPDIQIPHPFVDGETAVFCRPDLSDLLEKIDYYLARPEKTQAIAQAGQAHLLAHHTAAQRARFILEKIENC